MKVALLGKLLADMVIFVEPPGGDVKPLISNVMTDDPLAK